MTQRLYWWCWILLLCATAPTAPAQNALYIDLSGEWRQSTDDRPAYAQPTFDDSAWNTVTLPWTARPSNGVWWLRRALTLPAGTNPARLALTLGPVAEAYEVYVNGQLAAKAAGFSASEAQIPRDRTFDLPRVNGDTVSIAVRVWRIPPGRGTNQWRRFRGGIFALHYAGQFPADYGDLVLRRQQWRMAPDLVVAGINVLLGLTMLAFWLLDRRQPHLFWLALYVIAEAVLELSTVLLFSPEAHPWFHEWRNVPLASVRTALLAASVMAVYRLDRWWLRGLVWSLCLFSITMRWLELREPYLHSSNLSYLIIVSLIAFGWSRSTVFPSRMVHHGVAALFLILCFFLANRLGLQFGVTGTIGIGDSAISGSSTLSLLATLLLFGIVIWQILMQRQRLASEMEAARAVQQLLIPPAGDTAAGIQIDAVYEPAQEVGGDFHWRRTNPDGSLTIVTGDVSGKGLKAAMLVSVIVGLLRAEKSSSPAQILATLNDGLTEEPSTGFVTCCCVHVHGNQFTIASAGHPAPYADGRELHLEDNLPLGVVRGIAWTETTITASRLTLVSDGVPEAANSKGELLGFDRTAALSTRPAREIAEAARAWGQTDDITVVTVRSTAAA